MVSVPLVHVIGASDASGREDETETDALSSTQS